MWFQTTSWRHTLVSALLSKPEPEEIGLIQGREPDSKEEWRVSKALDKYGWEYMYQYQVFGGTQTRGGQVIDFLVFTVPLSTPTQVYGEYWHSGRMSSEDRIKQIQLETRLKGQMNKVLIIWGQDAQTQVAANAIIRRELGVNK